MQKKQPQKESKSEIKIVRLQLIDYNDRQCESTKKSRITFDLILWTITNSNGYQILYMLQDLIRKSFHGHINKSLHLAIVQYLILMVILLLMNIPNSQTLHIYLCQQQQHRHTLSCRPQFTLLHSHVSRTQTFLIKVFVCTPILIMR